MLILTRRVGETITIGDEIIVTVIEVKGNQVRIGVNAPKEVAVHREEVYELIRQEKAAANADAEPGATQSPLITQLNVLRSSLRSYRNE